MLIEQIRVFKTPLDSEYRNVYDSYSSLFDYYNFLSANFDYKDIPITAAFPYKSVKDIDGDFEIVASTYLSSDLHDYNYIYFRIRKDGGYFHRFGFITKIESVNDHMQDTGRSGDYSACKLTCKYDIWSNHYLEIKNSFNSVEENRCTIDSNIHRNYPTKLKTERFSETIDFSSTAFYSDTELYVGDALLIPIWQRISCVQEFQFYKGTSQGGYVYPTNNINGYATAYFLVGVLERRGNSIRPKGDVDIRLTFRENTLPTATTHSFTISSSIFQNLVETESDKVIENKIVGCVPFTYNISYTSGNPGQLQIEVNNVKVSCGDSAQISGTRIFYSPFYGLSPEIFETPTTIRKSFITSGGVTYYSQYRYAEQPTIFEPIRTEYPLAYDSLFIKGIDIPLKGTEKASVVDSTIVQTNYDCEKRSHAYITIANNGENQRFISCEGNEELPVYVDNYSNYMLYNGNQLNAQLQKSIMNGASSMISGGVSVGLSGGTKGYGQILGGLTSMLGGSVDYTSKVKDLENSGSEMLVNGTNSFDTLLFDIPFILSHVAISRDRKVKEYHRYGYECFYIGNLFECRRDVFDIDTGELTISALMANSDRKEIENAVSKGITRWHINGIDGDYSTARQNILKAMNRDVANYPISQIPTT